FNVSFSLDKGLDGIVNKFNISAGYNNSESSQINQNEIIEFLNQSFAVGSGIDAKFGRWGDLNYRINFSRSENVIRNDARDFIPINSASQSSQLNFFPANRLIVNLKYEYSYNSAITGSGRLMNFADAGIKYRLKKLDLNIIYNNIFNTRRYISAAYNGIGSYYSSYELRPAQVLVKVRFKIK
ncbi:MAG TPA: hypothetical protein VKB19_14300, partial [Pedobacter sp.]|nr:hypothetical protein [Pedobacter sp.]